MKAFFAVKPDPWQDYAKKKPIVPEFEVYGAAFMAIVLTFLFLKRRKK